MVMQGVHVPTRCCPQLSGILTFAIVHWSTGFLPMAALCALVEMLHPTLGKRGREPPKQLSFSQMQESYGDLIARSTK